MPASLPEVYTGGEIAKAAGVRADRIGALIASGAIRTTDGWFVEEREAVRQIRALRSFVQPAELPDQAASVVVERSLFAPRATTRRATGIPLLASGAVHATAFGLLMGLSMLGAFQPMLSRETTSATVSPMRLVYTVQPGPGGGGGGGGLRQPLPAPQAKLKGSASLSSPVPLRKPPPPAAPPKLTIPAPQPPLKAEVLPPIIAPVVSVASDAHDRVGVLTETPAEKDSRGSGVGGGVGTGAGTGVGEGEGSGIGPGTGGGFGGGAYRPGSGVEPPRVLREVKPSFTDQARRAGVEGEVVLEIIVLRDGTVGDIRVLQRLGSGLDERAIDAVKQWRFEPARRLGVPVDVVVEVSVEFKLR